MKLASLVLGLCALGSTEALAWQTGRLLNHRVRVPAREGNYLCFGVPRGRPVFINGQFRATGGNGNDIEMAIAQEAEAINWANGQVGNLLWSSEGKRSAGSFEVELAPGNRYCVAMSNRFSAVSDKTVHVWADLVSRAPFFGR